MSKSHPTTRLIEENKMHTINFKKAKHRQPTIHFVQSTETVSIVHHFEEGKRWLEALPFYKDATDRGGV